MNGFNYSEFSKAESFDFFGATDGQTAREKRAMKESELWDIHNNAVGDADKLSTKHDVLNYRSKWIAFIDAVAKTYPEERSFTDHETAIAILATIESKDRVKSQLTVELWSAVDSYKKGKEWNGKVTGQNTFKGIYWYNKFAYGLSRCGALLESTYGGKK